MDNCRVQITPAIAAFIADRIDAYDRECDPRLDWLSPYVREHRILPLDIGWIETTGITDAGLIRTFSADGDQRDYPGLRVPSTRTAYISALVKGASLYPPLAALVPSRPATAVDCSACNGHGHFASHPSVVCVCGGLGWLPGSAA